MLKGLSYLIIPEIHDLVRARIKAFMWLAIAFVFGLFAFGFLLIAAYQILLSYFSGLESLLIMSAILLTLCGAFILISYLTKRQKGRPQNWGVMTAISFPLLKKFIHQRNMRMAGAGSVVLLAIMLARHYAKKS
jgi:hypothetical protein